MLAFTALANPSVREAGAEGCPNEQTRLQQGSTGLPDCRAYELVSPADAGGLQPTGRGFGALKDLFTSSLTSPDGGSVVFNTVSGSLPGIGGTGEADRYEARRGPGGWTTRLIGPTSAQTEEPRPGGITPQHDYAFYLTNVNEVIDRGSLIEEAGGLEETGWTRYPDGSFEPIGKGTLATDFDACGWYIAPGGSHIVFASADCSKVIGNPVKLLADAPPDGTFAVYDRTPSGLHTVSLLPGDITPAAGENAEFKGASADGSTVLFQIEATLYARVDNAVTEIVATESPRPAGVSADGGSAFYVKNGDAFSFDTSSEQVTRITTSEDVELVNVAADGSRVYFVSPSQLDGGQGTLGAPNLYVWRRSDESTRFIATVAAEDVTGTPCLTCWTSQVGEPEQSILHGAAYESSRTTPDGAFLVFESRAQLTPYDNGGHTEVYLYGAEDQSLRCVSCAASGPASSDASLQSISTDFDTVPLYPFELVTGISDDGETVAFQTGDALAQADVDGTQDVYLWRDAPGAGGPTVSLISSGHSAIATTPKPPFGSGEPVPTNFLWGMSPDGHDVFFLTNDVLLPEDRNGGSGAIYDARVDGGFAPPPAAPRGCEGDGCQGEPSAPPSLPGPASTAFSGVGKAKAHRRHRHRHHHRHRKRHRRHGRRSGGAARGHRGGGG